MWVGSVDVDREHKLIVGFLKYIYIFQDKPASKKFSDSDEEEATLSPVNKTFVSTQFLFLHPKSEKMARELVVGSYY